MKRSGFAKSFLTVVAAVLAFFPGVSLHAAPPFRTDDPEPVEPGHWELYTFSSGNRHKQDTSAIIPGSELNYGAMEGVQLHLGTPFIYDKQTAGASSPDSVGSTAGYGDTELGVKIRFVDEDKDGWMPQIGIYPTVEVPTGKESDNTGKGHGSYYLPLWLIKSMGDFTVLGGVGYWFNPGTTTNTIPGPSHVTNTTRNQNYWFTGTVVLYNITEQLHFGPEIFHQTRSTDQPDGVAQTGFNVGGVWDITENDHFLLSSGCGIQNARDTNMFSYYIGYQRTW